MIANGEQTTCIVHCTDRNVIACIIIMQLIIYLPRLSINYIFMTRLLTRSQRPLLCRVTLTRVNQTPEFSAGRVAIQRNPVVQSPVSRSSSSSQTPTPTGNMSKKEDAKRFVEMKIHGKKVVVFSKSYCPYCSMAKNALRPHVGKEIKPEPVRGDRD